jgi:calcyphosin
VTHNIISHQPDSPKLDNFSSHEDEKASSVSRSERYSEAEKRSTTTSYYIKEVEMIVLRMKKRLASKGTRGYLILEKNLRNVDSDQDGLISLDELRKVVKDLKIDITTN